MKETTDSKILVTGMQPGVGPDVVGQSFGGFGAVEEYLSNVTDFFGFAKEASQGLESKATECSHPS